MKEGKADVKAAQQALAAQLPPVMEALGADAATANKVIANVAQVSFGSLLGLLWVSFG